MYLQAWKEEAQDRPLRLLVCGRGGAGKSTLVNRLLQLGDEKWAEEGMHGGATTSVVSKYERTTERGIKVCIFDSPGFDDISLSDEEIVEMMETETESKLDLMLYCIPLSGSSPRVQGTDTDALKILTQVFGTEVWKRAIIVLSFANKLAETKPSANEYLAVIENIKVDLNKALRKNNLSDKIIKKLPIVTAGHTNPILKYEEDKSPQAWDDRLFLEALEQVEPALTPALLQCRWSWADFKAAMAAGGAGGGSGVVLAGGVGAGIGTVIGVLGGPVGMGIGAAVGGAVGVAVGGATGTGVGLLALNIFNRKYKKYKMYKKLKNEDTDQEPPTYHF